MLGATQNHARLVLLILVYNYIFVKLTSTGLTSVFILDFYNKTTLNDAPIGWFHLYWVTLSYLPSVFILALITSMLLLRLYTPVPFVIILGFMYFYVVELEDFIFFNTLTNFSNPQTQLFNNLLTNLLNKYHPAIFYTSVICFTTYIASYGARSVLNERGSATKFYVIFNNWWGITLQTNLVALTLGSWWALQEGTWGGWWNWDPSETLGLLVSFTVLMSIHNNVTKSSILPWLNLSKGLFYLFISSYFFIQLNFEIVSHNFNFKLFHFFNSTGTIAQFFILVLLLGFIQLKSLMARHRVFYYLSTRAMGSWLRLSRLHLYLTYASFTPFVLLPLVSYLPIINYFTWNFLNVTFFYQTQPLEWLSFFIICSFFYRFGALHLSTTVFTSFITLTLTSFTYLYAPFIRGTLSIFHILLTLFLTLNLSALYSNYLVWDLGTVGTEVLTFSTCLFDKQHLVTCGDGLIERVVQWSDTTSFICSTWNISGTSNIFEVSDFLLVFNHTILTNTYFTNVDWYASTLLIELHNITNLVLITAALYAAFTYLWLSSNWRKQHGWIRY
jgi:cytochrome c biogenesis factor